MGGSSKKVTVGYRYYLGMHMILCHGPADKLLLMNVDNRKAWAGVSSGGRVQVNAEGLFGGEKREGGISGAVDVEMGEPTQGANSYLSQHLRAPIPAFRGVVGVVLRQCYLGMNPYLKRWSFRLTRIHKRLGGELQWYDAKAEIPLASVKFDYDGMWKYRVVERADGGAIGVPSQYTSPAYDDSSWVTSKGGFGSGGPGAGLGVGTYVPAGSAGRGIWIRKTININHPKLVGALEIDLWHDDGGWVWWNGEQLPTVRQPNYFHSKAFIPAHKIRASNVLVMQALDTIPGGSTSNIYAGVGIRGGNLDQADMNPIHIIRECLTDPTWGMGYLEADVDDAAFRAAADTLFEEQMGISILWDRQMPLEDFIQEIVKHIDAALYVDRTSGKFTIKLIRKDYDSETIPVLGENEILKVSNLRRPTTGELVNSVTVNFWEAIEGVTSSLTIQDQALIQMEGSVINTTVQYPGFTNARVAGIAALRNLRAYSTPLLNGTIVADRSAAALNIGDVFKLNWPLLGVEGVVMRVQQVALGDGRKNMVKITAIEDAFQTQDISMVTPAPDEWEDPTAPPKASDNVLVEEAPYFYLVRELGQTQADQLLAASPETGFLVVSASRPGSAINAGLFVDAGLGFQDSATLDFCPIGKTSLKLGRMDSSVVLTGLVDADLAGSATFAQIGDELVRIDSFDPETGLLAMGRGVLDTTPSEHPAGSAVFIWDGFGESDNTEYLSGETVQTQVLPITGQGMLASDTSYPLTFNHRAARPYPPGDFKINGEYFPETLSISGAPHLNCTWAHRDRLQQTGSHLIDFLDGDVGPEAGTTYRVELWALPRAQFPDALYTATEASTSHTIDLAVALPPADAIALEVMVYSVCRGLTSLQAQKSTMVTFEAPYDVRGTYLS